MMSSLSELLGEIEQRRRPVGSGLWLVGGVLLVGGAQFGPEWASVIGCAMALIGAMVLTRMVP